MVKVLSLKRPLTEVSSYFRLLRFSLSSMTGSCSVWWGWGPPLQDEVEPNHAKAITLNLKAFKEIHLWMLTSLPSSDPVGVISSDLGWPQARQWTGSYFHPQTWSLTARAHLMLAEPVCRGIWHRQLKLISHLLKTTTPENVPCVTATCGI